MSKNIIIYNYLFSSYRSNYNYLYIVEYLDICRMYMWLVIKCNEQLISLERVDYMETKLYVLQVSSSTVRKPCLKLYQEWGKRNREWKDTLTTTITIFLYNPFIISLNHILNSIRVKYITQVSSMCLHILYSFFQMFVLTRA